MSLENCNNRESVAGSVIQATGTVEFEDGLRTGFLPGGCWYSFGRINSTPSGGASWSWGQCGCHKEPCQTEFQLCWVLRMGGIKLQLLCGVRIQLAVGFFPYPGMIPIPGSVQDETGNYLDSQFVSTLWTWGKIPLVIPTFLPMEGVHQTKQNQGFRTYFTRNPRLKAIESTR